MNLTTNTKYNLLLTIALALSLFSCKSNQKSENTTKVIAEPKFAWENPSIPNNERVDLLIAEMTLEEKTSQLLDVCPPITLLGIPNRIGGMKLYTV